MILTAIKKTSRLAAVIKGCLGVVRWREIGREEYVGAFNEFGGSIEFHPNVITAVEEVTKRRVRYFGLREGGTVVAAIPLWIPKLTAVHRWVSASQLTDQIDLGQSEVFLPVSPSHRIHMPFRLVGISELQKDRITNVHVDDSNVLMLARGHKVGDGRLGGKVQYNQRTQFKRFKEAGGTVQDSRELPPAELVEIYRGLFRARWGKDPQGIAHMKGTLGTLRDLLGGYVLWHNSKPVAVQILYKHATPFGLLATGINGGVDPEFKAFAPGSILHYLNVLNLEEEAEAQSLEMRFSFGKRDAAYKELWCRPVPTYEA